MRKLKLTKGGSWVDREYGTVIAGRPGKVVGCSDGLADSMIATGEAVELMIPIEISIKPDAPFEPGPKPKAERKGRRGRKRKDETLIVPGAGATDDLGD